MARQLRLEIEGDGASARKALDGVADEADEAARATDRLGEQFQETARKSTRLQREIDKTRRELKDLNDEYEKTGDASILKKLQASTAELTKHERLKKKLSILDGEHEKSAGRVEKKLASIAKSTLSAGAGGILESLKSLSAVSNAAGPIGTGVVVAGAAAGTVPALAAAGGGILAGGAIGAVAGGVAGAAMQSESIRREWETLTSDLQERFQKATASWIPGVLDGIGIIADHVQDIPLEEVFRDAEKYIEPLAKGIGGLITEATDGLDNLVRAAEPVVKKLETSLPELGDDIGDSFEALGIGADGAAEALGDVLHVAGGLIQTFAAAAGGAGRLYEKLIDVPVLEQGHDLFMSLFDFEDLPDVAAKKLGNYTESGYDAAEATRKLQESVDALNQSFQDSFNTVLSGIEANLAYEEAQDKLTEGWNKQKGALDASTEKGRENIQLAVDYVEAAKEVRDAAIAAGDGSKEATDKANAAYQSQIQKLEGILVNLGVSKEEAHAFAQQFLGLDGLTVDTYIKVHYRSDGLPTNLGSRYGSLGDNHAGGGTFRSTGFKTVGEQGIETIFGTKGQYVATNTETKRLMSAWSTMASGGGGGSTSGGTLTLAAAPSARGTLADLVFQAFDRSEIMLFDSNGNQIRTRRG